MTIPTLLTEALQRARHVVVMTGAGISAESGIPTFRDAQTGLWARYKAEELATPEAFEANPALVWAWYRWRRSLVVNAQPNAGHRALVTMARHVPRFTLITQNVDGLHARAGSTELLELHGNILRYKCFDTGRAFEGDPGDVPDGAPPPRHPDTGGYLRPDVVWFGEALPTAVFDAAVQATRACDVFFSVGTSGLVYPAAQLPFMAANAGAMVVDVNIVPVLTDINERITLLGPSGETLPGVLARMGWA